MAISSPIAQFQNLALPARLSAREREVVKLVGEGRTSREIALLLGVTVKTAESHRSNVMLKLRVHSTVELVTYAIRNDIVQVHIPTLALPIPVTRNRSGHCGQFQLAASIAVLRKFTQVGECHTAFSPFNFQSEPYCTALSG